MAKAIGEVLKTEAIPEERRLSGLKVCEYWECSAAFISPITKPVSPSATRPFQWEPLWGRLTFHKEQHVSVYRVLCLAYNP